MKRSITSAITSQQLADLIDVDPTALSHQRDRLPTAVSVQLHGTGRPTLCYPVDTLAEFAMAKTAHLSEAECRLRLALGAESRRRPARLGDQLARMPWRIVVDAHGRHVAVPSYHEDLDKLAAADRLDAEQALAHERAQRTGEQP